MANASFSSITAGALNLTGSLTVNGRPVATEPKAGDAAPKTPKATEPQAKTDAAKSAHADIYE